MRYITRHTPAQAWRVDTPPRAKVPSARWFYDADYGGRHASLVEAQYVRDDCFDGSDEMLHARIKPRRERLQVGEQLPISVRMTKRGEVVLGRWQAEEGGRTRTRSACRSVARYGLEDAWRQVEEIVRAGVRAEAEKLAARLRQSRMLKA